ncbi:MAG TPA: glycosyltransferase [Actinomycetota bacterium]|nr:glycosyltransferase [Actinomycetota bacterium]
MMRVAVVSYHSSPTNEPGSGDAGGMTVYVRHLAAALADRGVMTDVFTRAVDDSRAPVQLSPGVRVVPIAAGPRRHLPKEELHGHLGEFVGGIRAFATTQRLSYDLIHSHYWQSGLAGAELQSVWGVPLVHSHHTLGKVKNRFLAPGDRPEPALRLAGEGEVIDTADVLIASTDQELEQLACLYGAAHDRLKTLHPGVDHGVFRPLPKAASRAELGLGDEAVMLFVGRIQRLKGVDLAISALEQLVPALDRDATLLVVGGASGTNGDEEIDRLRALAGTLGIADKVRFVGPQPHDRLPLYYSASDVVTVCSYSESFGFAALEAHACGVPVVGTPVGGLSHVVHEGFSGFLVDSRDPSVFAARLKTLLADHHLHSAFSREAVRSASSFSWDRSAEAFLELYECLVLGEAPEVCTC